jgi:hypothetical protein
VWASHGCFSMASARERPISLSPQRGTGMAALIRTCGCVTNLKNAT